MFEEGLKQAAKGTASIRWTTPMPGVQVCIFVMEGTESWPVKPKAGFYETLFCQAGDLHIETTEGRRRKLGLGDILLVADATQVRLVKSAGGTVCGILVVVQAKEASESLTLLRGLLGDISLDPRQVGRMMDDQQGIMLIHGGSWCESMFSLLAQLPQEEQGQYCTLKAMELLYLLCQGGLPLSPAPPVHYYDRDHTNVVYQIKQYIHEHLSEDLSISTLAGQFHISPTALKTSFRQGCGQPLHQYVSACRIRRAAELLRTTSLPISQIAVDIGYSSVSQFGSMFQRWYHCTPAQYRRQNGV